MESSILISTKQILGLDEGSDEFDLDIITHINSTFGILNQIGVGPSEAYSISSAENTWDELALPPDQLNLVRTYIFLKVQMLWDTPTTSFLIEARNKQIEEHEVRLNIMREEALPDG